MKDISIRRVSTLDDSRITRGVEVLAKAFREDPLGISLVGGDHSISTALFKGFIAATIVDGEAYFAQLDEEVVGVALWFGPGKEFLNTSEQREAGWNAYIHDSGLSQEAKAWQTEIYFPTFKSIYARCLPTPTSKLDGYHLTVLGVVPHLQGQGIGGSLVRAGLQRARQEGAFVCLDTYTDLDITIYKRLGGRVGGSDKLPSPWGDFTITIMTWKPEEDSGGIVVSQRVHEE